MKMRWKFDGFNTWLAGAYAIEFDDNDGIFTLELIRPTESGYVVLKKWLAPCLCAAKDRAEKHRAARLAKPGAEGDRTLGMEDVT